MSFSVIFLFPCTDKSSKWRQFSATWQIPSDLRLPHQEKFAYLSVFGNLNKVTSVSLLKPHASKNFKFVRPSIFSNDLFVSWLLAYNERNSSSRHPSTTSATLASVILGTLVRSKYLNFLHLLISRTPSSSSCTHPLKFNTFKFSWQKRHTESTPLLVIFVFQKSSRHSNLFSKYSLTLINPRFPICRTRSSPDPAAFKFTRVQLVAYFLAIFETVSSSTPFANSNCTACIITVFLESSSSSRNASSIFAFAFGQSLKYKTVRSFFSYSLSLTISSLKPYFVSFEPSS